MTKEKINKTSCSGISSRLNSHLLHNVLLATNHLGLKQPQNMGHILCATNPLKRSWAHYNQLSVILKTPSLPLSLTTLMELKQR